MGGENIYSDMKGTMRFGVFEGQSSTSIFTSTLKQQYDQFSSIYCDKQACIGGNVHEYAEK